MRGVTISHADFTQNLDGDFGKTNIPAHLSSIVAQLHVNKQFFQVWRAVLFRRRPCYSAGYIKVKPQMMSDRFMGWGAIFIGVVVSCPGILEIASGEFSPEGYRPRSAWLKAALSVFFGPYAPYVSALVWLALGAAFIAVGLRQLRRGKEQP